MHIQGVIDAWELQECIRTETKLCRKEQISSRKTHLKLTEWGKSHKNLFAVWNYNPNGIYNLLYFCNVMYFQV